MKNKSKIAGVTLLELIIVMVLVGILASSMSLELTQGLRSYFLSSSYMQGDWQARTALERMTREIRGVSSGSAITNATSGNFTFTDVTGNTTSFSQVGSQILRNSQALADNVQNLAFSYYTENGTSTTVNTSICYIVINIAVAYQGYTTTLATAVYPWNLQ